MQRAKEARCQRFMTRLLNIFGQWARIEEKLKANTQASGALHLVT